jgi:hypothetical protein
MSKYFLCKGGVMLTVNEANNGDVQALSNSSVGDVVHALTTQMGYSIQTTETAITCFIEDTLDGIDDCPAEFDIPEDDHLGIALLALLYQGYSVIEESIVLQLTGDKQDLGSRDQVASGYQPISL